MENKKLTAVAAAVTTYIKTEEEALLASMAAETRPQKAVSPANLWGVSGRQAMMQNRNLMQLKTFHRSPLR